MLLQQPAARVPRQRAGGPLSRARRAAQRPLSVTTSCAQGTPRSGNLGTRLGRSVSTLPQRVDAYFEGKPLRRLMWCGISACAGFYLANTVSLSFGALAVNDVVAAALSVAFVEWAQSKFYGAWPNPPYSLWLLQCFKIGFTWALICDAFKLGG